MTRSRRHVRQGGLTLIELMISMVILSIAIAAALSLGFTMMTSYREQSKSSAVERAARVSLEMMADAVRNGMPGGYLGNVTDMATCSNAFGTGGTPLPVGGVSGIWVKNNTADGTAAAGTDQLFVIYAAGGALGTLQTTMPANPITVTHPDVQIANATFNDGDFLMIFDQSQAHLVQIATATDNGTGTTFDLDLDDTTACWADPTYTANDASVVRAKVAHFYISPTFNGLMMDPDADGPETAVPLADGIEDLQIAVGIDKDGDPDTALTENKAAIDDDDWFYNYPGDSDPDPTELIRWRALRMTITAVSISENVVTGTSALVSARPAAEDRTAGTVDEYRRRTLSTIVDIRNLKGSP